MIKDNNGYGKYGLCHPAVNAGKGLFSIDRLFENKLVGLKNHIPRFHKGITRGIVKNIYDVDLYSSMTQTNIDSD